ncbi:MAG: riboflavin biosynthesis protein RibF, partial [Bacteroidota bacterium]
MKRVYGVEQIERSGAARVTIGTFDGVHLGHRTIIEYLVERARTLGGESVVVSFDPHPRDVLTQDPMPLLTTIEERARKLEAAGLDRFVVLPFTPAFAQMEADVFVREVLWERLGAQEVVIGYDHAFGNRRAGDAALLQRLGEELGFAVDVIPAQLLAEHVISSTEIRRRLHAGQVAQAAELLGSPYSLEGPVVHGDHRGRTIGFPTANIAVSHPKKLIPKRGVYAVWAYPAGETTRWPGMMN